MSNSSISELSLLSAQFCIVFVLAPLIIVLVSNMLFPLVEVAASRSQFLVHRLTQRTL